MSSAEGRRFSKVAQAINVAMSIPVVDLAPWFEHDDVGKRTAAAQQLSAAFESTGFAVVTGTGIDEAIGRECWERAQDFHRLPLEEKLPLPDYRAQGGENVAQLLGVWDQKPDMCDKLSIKAYRKGKQNATNIWGAAAAAVEGLDAAIDRHCASLQSLYKELLRMGEVALGCEPGYFDAFHGAENSALQVSNYFQDLEADEHRFGAHTDSAMLSILRTDVPGLEVRLRGSWVPVPVVAGGFVVNVGRLLGRWTNDTWKAAVHRVSDDAPSARITLAYFTQPNPDALITPIPSCGPTKYAPVVFSDFMHQRDLLHIPGRGSAVPKEFWEADLSVAEVEAERAEAAAAAAAAKL
jgi:isopenicillin N synthase-like dioxygenase